ARTQGVLASAPDRLTVRVYGSDYGVLGDQAQRIRRVLMAIHGVGSAQVALPVRQPSIQIEVNLPAALDQQVKPGDVRRQAATLVSGTTVGYYYNQQKVFEVVVRGVDSTHGNLS